MGLNADHLRRRATDAAQSWHPGAEVTTVRPLTGGASSLTYVAELASVPDADRTVVLKVAPPGLEPVRNRDVLRQGRLMNSLHGRPGVVVPCVYFDDAGDPPDVPPFVAMGFVPGECTEPILDEARDPSRFGQIRARALDAARVLAKIHQVDVAAAGLDHEPVMWLGDEIDRWTRAFTTVPDDLRTGYERSAAALHASMPASLHPMVNHGDYRLGNTLCADDRVTAVIDWEIWSIGDPRIDVSWLTYFTDEARHPAAPSNQPSGMPTAAELMEAYTTAGGAALDDFVWFDALTRYKEAAATALLIKRGRKSGDLSPGTARMESALAGMLVDVEHLVDRRTT